MGLMGLMGEMRQMGVMTMTGYVRVVVLAEIIEEMFAAVHLAMI